MPQHERALSWRLGDDELVGVLAAPEGAQLGVLIVVGGPQCRTGSHRMFTLLARGLAAQGLATLPARRSGRNSPSCQSSSRRRNPNPSQAPTTIRCSSTSRFSRVRRARSTTDWYGPPCSRSASSASATSSPMPST